MLSGGSQMCGFCLVMELAQVGSAIGVQTTELLIFFLIWRIKINLNTYNVCLNLDYINIYFLYTKYFHKWGKNITL